MQFESKLWPLSRRPSINGLTACDDVIMQCQSPKQSSLKQTDLFAHYMTSFVDLVMYKFTYPIFVFSMEK